MKRDLRGLAAFMLLAAALVAGCGSAGGGDAAHATGFFRLTTDDYGLVSPTYLSATHSAEGVTLRASIASSMTDPGYRTVFRVDIDAPGELSGGSTFALGDAAPGASLFPGTISFFNGYLSTVLQTVGGAITFTSWGCNPGDEISGSFKAIVSDGVSPPPASYTIGGSFRFLAGMAGPIADAP